MDIVKDNLPKFSPETDVPTDRETLTNVITILKGLVGTDKQYEVKPTFIKECNSEAKHRTALRDLLYFQHQK